MILYDLQTGRISGAGLVERIGMELMRMSANILAPIEFTGFSWAARIIRLIFRSDRQVRVLLGSGSVFEYPYGDGYWGVLLYNRKSYNPLVEPYLKSFSDIRYAFIDCGSNFGYMSVLASSPEYGSNPAIAIEADLQNYQRTVHNSEINGFRYEYRHNAVYSESGKKVAISDAKHEARSIVENDNTGLQEEVETLALNDLSHWLKDKGDLPIILKLDVEGVETDALKGAGKILERDCLIIYEEHGADKVHEVSRFLKDVLAMRLFVGDATHMHMREITGFGELDALKTNPREGYDLFATDSEFWIERLQKFKQT